MLTQAAEETWEFDAGAATVWNYRLDFTNLPAYNPDVTGFAQLTEGSGPGGRCGVGATYRFDLATPYGSHEVVLEVTTVVPGKEVSASMTGAMRAEEVFRVAPLGDSRCRATMSLWLDLPEGLDAEQVQELLTNGRRSVCAELDAMARLLSPRVPPR